MQFKINNFYYNDEKGIVKKGDQQTQLTNIQKKLLDYFISHPQETLSKQVLMDDVWQRIVNDNTVNKSISKLRNIIEDNPKEPTIIVTVFGHGIIFEGSIEQIETKKQDLQVIVKHPNSFFNKYKWFLAVIALSVIGYFLYQVKSTTSPTPIVQNLKSNQPILMLPTFFEEDQGGLLQNGSSELVKSTLSSLDNKATVLFDDTKVPASQLMEKHWKINKELVIIQTSVEKHGEIYDAVMNFSKGYNSINSIKISANNLTSLSNKQLEAIGQYHNGIAQFDENNLVKITKHQKQILALGHMKNKSYQKAEELFKQILDEDQNNYIARFNLANTYFEQKKFDDAMTQVQTLKLTPLYQSRGGAIEFFIASIKRQKNQNQSLIDGINTFLFTQDVMVSEYWKAKLKLHQAQSYVSLGNMSESLKLYKQSIINLDDRLYPDIFASSYHGQASMLELQSNDNKVIDLYNLALEYSIKSGNTRVRIVILNSLAMALYAKNDWQQGIDTIKQAISLMETDNTVGSNDSEGVAYGLSILVMFLEERGLYSEAKTVLEQFGKKAQELKSDILKLTYQNYDAALAIDSFEYEYAQEVINKQYTLAKKINNFVYLLNNSFIQLELLLKTKNTLKFKQIYDERIILFDPQALDKYRNYMHWYLARYYKILNQTDESIKWLNQVSELALSFKENRLFIDAQNTLSEVYLINDPLKALAVLNNLESYSPNPNPYLVIKAQVLHSLGKKIEALAIMTEAKASYNEAWKAENQAFLERLKLEVN